MPKSEEVAKLAVANVEFEDWDTVWVQHRWMDPWPLFRFSCAERADQTTNWALMKFKPGDPCTIILGGQLAMTGVILARQTTYDATTHTVLLSGAGRTWAGANSSVNSKDGNFDNMGFTQVAFKVWEPYGPVKVIGQIDNTPFTHLQCQPGELTFDFLDRCARPRGVTLGSDVLGNFLIIGKHSYPVVQQLTEGENILKMTCVFNNDQISTIYSMKGQKPADDNTSAREAAEMVARAKGTMETVFRFLETVAEQPVKNRSEIEARNNYEAIQREATKIMANVTVQGWLRGPGQLWEPGELVWVYSPMAMLNMAMKIRTAAFAQDDTAGTTTTLELVLPWMLGDQWAAGPNGRGPNTPQPPGASTSVDGPAAVVSA